ncbi:hypothetical protein [Rhodococcus opacus]|uniref:hypothetical protein n=1 Tax=Rhodococcus opacus TaxID=37919 RepID=UPI00155AD689|nr:hypothetical protein [Rhodococcus opacus]
MNGTVGVSAFAADRVTVRFRSNPAVDRTEQQEQMRHHLSARLPHECSNLGSWRRELMTKTVGALQLLAA